MSIARSTTARSGGRLLCDNPHPLMGGPPELACVELSDSEIERESKREMLDRMAVTFMVFFQARGRKRERMQEFEFWLRLSSVSESQSAELGRG